MYLLECKPINSRIKNDKIYQSKIKTTKQIIKLRMNINNRQDYENEKKIQKKSNKKIKL